MCKTISILIMFITITLALPAKAGIDEGVNYLKNQTQDDWVVMALAAADTSPSAQPLQTFSGTSATDIAKRILALTAVGENPTVFTGDDLVQKLKAMSQSDQLGETYLLNDDAWGILALRSAGVSSADAVISSAKDYLLANQNSDGGWSWGVGYDSDTNDTAAVIMALIEAGLSSSSATITDAVEYLSSTQEADGGWAYEPVWDSDAASTAWVITALNKLGQSDDAWAKNEATPLSFLLSLQTDDGSFKWVATDSSGSASMTAFSVIALSGRSFPVQKPTSVTSGSSGGRQVEKIDLKLSVNNEKMLAEVDQEISYTLNIENKGPDSAFDIIVENVIPVDFIGKVIFEEGKLFDEPKNTWRLNVLGSGFKDTAVVTLVPQVDQNLSWEVKAAKTSSWEEEGDWRDNNINLNLQIVKMSEPQVLGESTVVCDTATTAGEVNKKLVGFTLRVDDGTAWYYDPVSLKRYCLPDADTAYKALGIFGLGITNDDLEKIPVAGESVQMQDEKLMSRLKGRILLQVEDLGQAWYVDPRDGTRHYLANGLEAMKTLTNLSIQVSIVQLSDIPIN